MARETRSNVEKALVGPAGEHYVLYKLHRLGGLAALAPRNLPDVDVLVFEGDGAVAASLQVKTRTTGADKGWHMKKKHEGLVSDRLFYAFVDLESDAPTVFIVPSAVVADVCRRTHVAWLSTPGKNGQQHEDTEMRRIQPAYKYVVPGLAAEWLEQWRERWDLITRPAVIRALTGT